MEVQRHGYLGIRGAVGNGDRGDGSDCGVADQFELRQYCARQFSDTGGNTDEYGQRECDDFGSQCFEFSVRSGRAIVAGDSGSGAEPHIQRSIFSDCIGVGIRDAGDFLQRVRRTVEYRADRNGDDGGAADTDADGVEFRQRNGRLKCGVERDANGERIVGDGVVGDEHEHRVRRRRALVSDNAFARSIHAIYGDVPAAGVGDGKCVVVVREQCGEFTDDGAEREWSRSCAA